MAGSEEGRALREGRDVVVGGLLRVLRLSDLGEILRHAIQHVDRVLRGIEAGRLHVHGLPVRYGLSRGDLPGLFFHRVGGVDH